MNRSALLLVSLVLAGVASAAQAAATLTRVSGGVRVNQGVEFVEAFEQLALQPGDRIMTLENGRARITFDDGCDLDAGPNTMVTVPETSTCAGGQALTQNIAPGGTEAVGAGQSFNWRRALLIALPVAAAVAIYEHNRDDDATVSP